MLTVQGLNAGYGALHILKDVNLEVRRGEIVALLGPNGAGKSTMLKAIIHLADVYGGSIVFDGIDTAHIPTHSFIEMGIAFVPQGRLVFPSLTVQENLRMGGYLLDHKETVEKKIEEVFMRFPQLEGKRRERAGNLSGGEQQMVALGRALMMTPKFLMLDEPSLGLSPKVTGELFQEIQKINESGVTVMIVEQNVHRALTVAHRAYLFANGEVRFTGKPEELHDMGKMRSLYLGEG